MEMISILFEEYLFNRVPSFIFAAMVIACLIINPILDHSSRKIQRKFEKVQQWLYLATLVVLMVFCRRTGIQGIRIVNYWLDSGILHDYSECYLTGFVANVLLFIPLGYMIRESHRRTHWIKMGAKVLGVGMVIEVLQYVTRHGCIGISDLVAYLIGGIIGILICAREVEQYFRDMKCAADYDNYNIRDRAEKMGLIEQNPEKPTREDWEKIQ